MNGFHPSLVPGQQPHLFSTSPQHAPSPQYQQGNVAVHANQFAAASNAMPLPQFGVGPSSVDGHRLPPSAAFDGRAASGAAGGDGNTEKVLLPYDAASVAQAEKQSLLPGAPPRSELAAPSAADTNLKAKTKQIVSKKPKPQPQHPPQQEKQKQQRQNQQPSSHSQEQQKHAVENEQPDAVPQPQLVHSGSKVSGGSSPNSASSLLQSDMNRNPEPQPQASKSPQGPQDKVADKRKYVKSGNFSKAQREADMLSENSKQQHQTGCTAPKLMLQQPQSELKKRPYIKSGLYSKKHASEDKSPKPAPQLSAHPLSPSHLPCQSPHNSGEAHHLRRDPSSGARDQQSSRGHSNGSSPGSHSNAADAALHQHGNSAQRSLSCCGEKLISIVSHRQNEAASADAAILSIGSKSLAFPHSSHAEGDSRSPEGGSFLPSSSEVSSALTGIRPKDLSPAVSAPASPVVSGDSNPAAAAAASHASHVPDSSLASCALSAHSSVPGHRLFGSVSKRAKAPPAAAPSGAP
jgi:hypothetical protein